MAGRSFTARSVIDRSIDLGAEKTVRNIIRSGAIVVNLRNLKRYSLEKLPKDWPLRDVLLAEDDEVPASEFPGKVKVWLALLQYAGRD